MQWWDWATQIGLVSWGYGWVYVCQEKWNRPLLIRKVECSGTQQVPPALPPGKRCFQPSCHVSGALGLSYRQLKVSRGDPPTSVAHSSNLPLSPPLPSSLFCPLDTMPGRPRVSHVADGWASHSLGPWVLVWERGILYRRGQPFSWSRKKLPLCLDRKLEA